LIPSDWILPVVVGAFLAAVAYLQFIRPWHQIKRDLERMASGDFSLGGARHEPGPHLGTARHIKRISELLQQLDRQIADEDLSLRAILSSMVEGILIANRWQRITLVNEALTKAFSPGRSPLGRTVMELFRRHELLQAVERALDTGQSSDLELSLECHGGKGIFHIRVAALTPESSPTPQAALLVFQDVTEVRNLEATRREFIANVSHEFLTPLAIINGYVETLLDGALEEPDMARRSLGAMQRNVKRLSLLIDDLLLISRLENKVRLLSFAHEDLGAILERTLDNLAPAVAETGASIEVSWDDGARHADTDAHRMEQVFANLLTNALRYGGSDEPRITITGRREGEIVAITFADNGPGIPLEDQKHLFERFYRVHKDRSRGAGGTGLGLSIVKNIVLAHGGSVGLESTPGNGAAFTVRIPVRHKHESPTP
jgi:two-component system, OmpR family, phosphate regulon sensor histidine kinase PhoR